jgi:hypothetical protein
MIAEVLKRNPNLVSSGKNTKLKIVQRSPWWAKARVSFVLLKPTTADEENVTTIGTKPSILRQHNAAAAGGRKSGASGLGSSGAIAVNKRVSPFDNVTGPWICYDCLQTTEDGQSAALRLKTYYEYRCHLIQTHGFKSDSQVCYLFSLVLYKHSCSWIKMHFFFSRNRPANIVAIEPSSAIICYFICLRFMEYLLRLTLNFRNVKSVTTLP